MEPSCLWQQVQYTKQDNLVTLNNKGKTLILLIVGIFSYYGRSIETPMLVALNKIGSQQALPTEQTLNKENLLMDFLLWHPGGKIQYFTGTMQLAVDSDAAYLIVPGTKSMYTGHFLLGGASSLSKS